MMVVGDAQSAYPTRPESFPNSSQTPTGRPAPTSTIPRDGSSHIQYRNAAQQQNLHPEGQPLYDRLPHPQSDDPPPTGAIPPPSPRLEPTHRSTLSLNGSVANSPSRIKVRDLGHIQSFASEEVLTRSRHPSRHSLRGRLAGGQQYEISAMPVADIIEMVAGLLTKITTTVG